AIPTSARPSTPVEEETGIKLNLEDMVDLTAVLYPDTGCRMLPSPVNGQYYPTLLNIWHNFSSKMNII
uniref:Uncharacterized protein n=1 Tax=Oryza brachyantha TaxID=4533 RepID=J3MKG6_ORYBR